MPRQKYEGCDVIFVESLELVVATNTFPKYEPNHDTNDYQRSCYPNGHRVIKQPVYVEIVGVGL